MEKKGQSTNQSVKERNEKDVSIKINKIGSTGTYEVITSGRSAASGRVVVLTSPRALAFPKKG